MAEHCPACGYKLTPDALLEWGGWTLDETSKMLTMSNGETYQLTNTATAAMGALIRARGRVVTKDSIYAAMYSMRPECDQPELKCVDVYICKLKARSDTIYFHIGTVWGRGYELHALS